MKFLNYLTAAALALVPSVVFAHHPLDGEAPTTILHGLFSGFAHPILGFDHLAFIIAVGVVTAFTSQRLLGPLGFLVGMFAGVLLTLTGLKIGFAEYIIMASVVGIGALAIWGRSINSTLLVAGLALIGLFHGYAYGGAVIGSEPTPILAYLAALLVVQGAIILGAQEVIRAFAGFDGARAPIARVTGGVVAGIGAAISLETIEGLLFAAV